MACLVHRSSLVERSKYVILRFIGLLWYSRRSSPQLWRSSPAAASQGIPHLRLLLLLTPLLLHELSLPLLNGDIVDRRGFLGLQGEQTPELIGGLCGRIQSAGWATDG